MEIRVELMKEDIIDFKKYYFKKYRFKKLLFLSLVLSFVLPLTYTDKKHLHFYDLIPILIFHIIYWGLYYREIKSTKGIALKKGKYIEERKYIIQENEMICISENSTVTFKWISGIMNMDIGVNAIYLYVNKTAIFIIPKRSFDDEKSVNNFIENIRTKINVA